MSEVIAIAGATGFVGRALIKVLSTQRRIIGLSRSEKQPTQGCENVAWCRCNLFNLRHTEEAPTGASVAYNSVHSILPQAALTQASFNDMDLLCADNFARAARSCGVKHIVCLSGLVPSASALSRHLAVLRWRGRLGHTACP